MNDIGIWDCNGKCHAYDLNAEQAQVVAGRCERLLGKSYAPFFVGSIAAAKAQGFKNHYGEDL
jgi:hypothetical protein